MSRNFSVDFTLIASYNNKKNILKILENGAQLGFIYYDHVLGEIYQDAPTLTPEQTLNKILNAAKTNKDGGPTVYVSLGDSNYSFLSFYDDEDFIQCHLFGMAPIKRRTFEENIYEIDFEFYIQLMLKLCNGFAIKQIELGEY